MAFLFLNPLTRIFDIKIVREYIIYRQKLCSDNTRQQPLHLQVPTDSEGHSQRMAYTLGITIEVVGPSFHRIKAILAPS